MNDQRPARFDELIHSPVRLRICGLLRNVDRLEFAVLRDTLGLTDAHLSKNLKILADAGILVLSKESSSQRGDRRRSTWIALTTAGRNTLASHLLALEQIIEASPHRG